MLCDAVSIILVLLLPPTPRFEVCVRQQAVTACVMGVKYTSQVEVSLWERCVIYLIPLISAK